MDLALALAAGIGLTFGAISGFFLAAIFRNDEYRDLEEWEHWLIKRQTQLNKEAAKLRQKGVDL